MNLGIEGRVALVAGASSGLGRAVAHELAMEGASVAILARRGDELRRVAAELSARSRRRIVPLVADVTSEDATRAAVAEAVETLGPIDILVGNAGGPPATIVEETTLEQFRSALELNLLSSVRLAQLCVPEMRRRQWGRVIFLTSTAARQPIPSLILSNTARAGLAGFAKTLATDCARDNVLVNTILTGHFDTDRAMSLAAGRSSRQGLSIDQVLAERRKLIPMGRAGHPAELAAVVAFLASDRASFVTGTALAVDGGQIATVF
ncbi:MAG TPA: SDR family oxidoreductase [Gemmatimonadaceae bacterium]|nr:SDR family oxidoreductase [Gemmatimonadaceae bacterium]